MFTATQPAKIASGKELIDSFLTPENIEKYLYFGNATSNQSYCADLVNFYKLQEYTSNNYDQGWFEYEYQKVNTIQQILFVCFTIIGFALIIVSIGFRTDIFLKDEWTSSLILMFGPSIITACLQVVLLAKMDGKMGLRCFACHLSPTCQDIQPLTLNFKWPGRIDWIFTFYLALAVKLFDMYVIAGITLTFILDMADVVIKSVLKIISWLILFPWILFTPVFGCAYFVLFASLSSKMGENEAYFYGQDVGNPTAVFFENLPQVKGWVLERKDRSKKR